MLGLPASAGAPALAETGGRAVAQLLPPWSALVCEDTKSNQAHNVTLVIFQMIHEVWIFAIETHHGQKSCLAPLLYDNMMLL